MIKTNISRQAFDAVFDACMNINEASVYVDEKTLDTFKIRATMVIRVFQEDDACIDEEFTDNETAWKFFKTNAPFVRVMDAAGGIYFDYF